MYHTSICSGIIPYSHSLLPSCTYRTCTSTSTCTQKEKIAYVNKQSPSGPPPTIVVAIIPTLLYRPPPLLPSTPSSTTTHHLPTSNITVKRDKKIMPSQSNELSSVEDFDLLTIEARLTELERRKSLLTAELLSYRSTLPISTILSQAKVTPSYGDPTSITSTVGPKTETSSNGSAALDGKAETTDEDILSDVIAHTRYSQKERLKKLYRMTGVTTFTSRDPSPPHKVNVGIRFELFGNRKSPPLPSSPLPLFPSSPLPLFPPLPFYPSSLVMNKAKSQKENLQTANT